MAASLDIKFSTDLSLVRRKLTNISQGLKDGLEEEIKGIAQRAAQRLRETTPGEELPKGWKAVPLPGTRAVSRWAVINTDPRANKPVRASGRTLLHILEYGTVRNYAIKAKTKEGMVFFWPKANRGKGATVRLFEVTHPGLAPGFFIRPAVAAAKAEQAAASRRLAQKIRQGLE